MAHTTLLFELIHERGVKLLEAAGEVVIPDSLDEEALLPLLARADAVVLRAMSGVTRRLMEAAPRLKVVGRHGIGVNNVDVDAATELGIWVVNTPEAPAESVAEHFFLLALALCRHFLIAEQGLRDHDWNVRYRAIGVELQAKTLGVVGLGRIGRLIAHKCRAAFDNRILYSDVVAAPPDVEKALGAERLPLERLMAESDFVVLAVPLVRETHHLIGAEAIAKMKPSAYLINVCRGPVWDESALLRALIERRIAGAATDVFEDEPPGPIGRMLLRLANFVGTPHIAAHTEEALVRMAGVAEDIARVLEGQEPRWPVNRPARPRAGGVAPVRA